jgi:VIT1/CCC1 family predicted Fe2+/Mn2+ transporter
MGGNHETVRLEHDHSREAIAKRLAEGVQANYLRDWIYGGIDGAVTTFAIVAGVQGAGMSSKVILILGVANLVADGFSMAAGNFSGTKAEVDEVHKLREMEHRHVTEFPDGEREELRQILASKGLGGEALEGAVEALSENETTWVEFMLTEEYGVPRVLRSPIKAALSTFAAFLLCGLVPLLPYLNGSQDAFVTASVMTACVFFAIGAVKSRWSLQSWWWSGLETLLIGTVAAAAAYGIGAGLQAFIT